ncbi:MAG TPA: ATP-binding protein, partial [Pseudomonadales bacterium]
MQEPRPNVIHRKVRGTAILPGDSPEQIREKLASIAMDAMYEFVGVLDPQGTLLLTNPAALEGAGITDADVVGKPFWECPWWTISEQTREELRAAVARAAAGEFVRYDVEIVGRARGAETIVIDFSLIPVRDENGEVAFIVPEGRDITEKKAYEQEIAQKNVELQMLLERIRELADLKTRFFTNVSHELRTPLALILGPATRLAKGAQTMSANEQRDAASTIARNARLLLKHVNDLLDVSRLEAGKLNIDLKDTDLPALVRFVLSHFEVLARERAIDLRVEVPDESCVCAVDAAMLQRVLMNLLSNAFKFTPDGGVIRCRLQSTSAEMRLSVDDSGPGVPPPLRESIFERFRQEEHGATHRFPGTGLGLAIAREFVELQKGRIAATDSDLGGASFRVSLPARRIAEHDRAAPPPAMARTMVQAFLEELRPRPSAPEPSTGTAEASNGAPGSAPRPRVLVVEDNADMNRFVVQSLGASYEVRSAYDGREGCELALAEPPDLIITDIMMPRMSGEAMIQELRRHPQLTDVPVLLLSAKADEELKLRLLQSGAQDFIDKPFDERELAVRVRNLVSVKQGKDALRESERQRREAIETANRELEVRNRFMIELFERSPSSMAVLRGPQHVFEMANASYLRLVGHRDILQKPLLEALPELEGQAVVEGLDDVLRTGETVIGSMPVRLQRTPGAPLEQRFIDFIHQPLRNARGEVVGVFFEGHDVTDHKRAEDALRDADRRKDEFLATLAHELRNPLAPIRHAAQIIQSPKADGEQIEWAHAVIDRQVAHMARLLDDLLEVSRITRGTLELRRERLALQDVLSAAADTAKPLIELRGHRLICETPDAPIEVDADPVRLAQIFSNLLTNAAKYTPPGG